MEEDRVASPEPKEVEQVASPVPAVPVLMSKFVEEQQAPSTKPDESLETGEDNARRSDPIERRFVLLEERVAELSQEQENTKKVSAKSTQTTLTGVKLDALRDLIKGLFN